MNDKRGFETASTTPVVTSQNGVSDFPVKLGAPFTVGNTTYTPADIANYDEVGYASYYGAELVGRPTANGESFIATTISAAHKTLPMPSYVEVTALDTGRTILIRINDRGPFANDRLIDLSEGAARQLGITGQGVAGVRVRKVNPPEQERAVLREGMLAADRTETPESLLRVLRDKLAKLPKPSGTVSTAALGQAKVSPSPTSTSDGRFIREDSGTQVRTTTPTRPSPPAAAGEYVVQIAAFSSRARADQLAHKLGASVATSADGKLFRVRYGPYATEAEGERGLASAKQKGYPKARLYRD
ncbi:MAG: septal ring lytic transglycosylase RlpA family protein [Sphingorhabdus sp.]